MKTKNLKVIGLGGAGINVLNYMISNKVKGVDFAVIDTDAGSLSVSKAEKKLCIETVKCDKDDIRKVVNEADWVCIVSGMGGNTGTALVPVVADVCNKENIPVAALVTSPFDFEGKKAQLCCKKELKNLEKCKCPVKVIANQQIITSVNSELSIKDSFRKVDEMITNGVLTIKTAIENPDFDTMDLSKVMETIVCTIEQKK